MTNSSKHTSRLRGLPLAGRPLILILLTTLLLHVRSLSTPFLADDYLFLDQVRTSNLLHALTTPDPLGNYYRPLSRQVYFWCLAHTGASPALAHLVNLILFLCIPSLLYVIVLRLYGLLPATCAACIVAFHYSFDVPIIWVSGSQDLLSIVFALACLWLAFKHKWHLASLFYALGLLSKETIVGTPLLALFLTHRPTNSFRTSLFRTWPLWLAGAFWLMLWLHFMRATAVHNLTIDSTSVLQAFAHLPLVASGWIAGSALWSMRTALTALITIAASLTALLLTAKDASLRYSDSAISMGLRYYRPIIGLTWLFLGTLPV